MTNPQLFFALQALETKIVEHGGSLSTSVPEMACFISSEASVKGKQPKLLQEASKAELPILKEEFVHDLCAREGLGERLHALHTCMYCMQCG